MSLTYIAGIAQFLVTLGVITTSEAAVLSEGVMAIASLVALITTLYGRWRAGGIDLLGRK